MLKWLPPYRATLKLYGKEFGDLVFGTHGDDFLVSEVFADIFQHHRLEGLSGFQAVELIKVHSRRKKLPTPPRYLHTTIAWGPAALDLTASGVEWFEPPTCMECRTCRTIRWQRVVIEKGTWTGEDIFVPRGLSGTWVVSARFKSLCDEYQIKNAQFIPAEEYAYDFYPGMKDPSELDRFRPRRPELE
jgi:hypothetical protein